MTESKGIVMDMAWIVDGPDGARILKAERPSQQLTSDPFTYAGAAESGLQRPPYDLDRLVGLLGADPAAPGNTLHAKCVQQKATDVVGRGVTLRGRDLGENVKPSSQQEDAWGGFVRSVEDDDRGDGSLKERLTWAHQDFEGVGWGVLEVSRRRDGVIDGLWHVPGHTVRPHADGKRFAQKRGSKIVWFKRFGVEGEVDRKDGTWWPSASPSAEFRGNEVIVVKNYSPGSSFYGLPDHIPALFAIAGMTAQAEFNVRFFGNHAVPSYAVIIEGATLGPNLEATILDHFRQIKGDPARTIIIPVPGNPGADESMQPKLRFERLSVEVKEASFRQYKADNALEICIAHGVPPYRVGWPVTGSLGGNVAEEMTAIYNDSIVQPRQETWELRLDRTLLGARGLQITDWQLKCNELDTRNEMRDLEKAKLRYLLGIATPADLARYFGGDRDDAAAHRYIASPLHPQAGTVDPMAGVTHEIVAKAEAWKAEVQEMAAIRKRLAAISGLALEAVAA